MRNQVVQEQHAKFQECYSLRNQVVQEQHAKFQEWAHLEQKLNERNTQLKEVNTRHLQLQSQMVFYRGQHRLQADLELEIS